MSDPQLPPPFGSVPPVSPAAPTPPAAPAAPVHTAPSAAQAPPAPPAAAGANGVPPVPLAPGFAAPEIASPSDYAAPPGAYQVPVGGYASPNGSYAVPEPTRPGSKLLGTLSLVLALVAAIVTPIVAAFAAYEVGRRVPESLTQLSYVSDVTSLAFLAPARDQVLWAELSFWTGTALGIAAIVLGIMAIIRKRGRGFGIGGLIAAALGPAVFFMVVAIAVSLGTAAGAVGLVS